MRYKDGLSRGHEFKGRAGINNRFRSKYAVKGSSGSAIQRVGTDTMSCPGFIVASCASREEGKEGSRERSTAGPTDVGP